MKTNAETMNPFTHLQLWQRPANYAGATWYDYYPIAGQSRDSGTQERSNFRAFHAALKAKAAELGGGWLAHKGGEPVWIALPASEVPNSDHGKPADRDGYGPAGNLVCDETITAFTVERSRHWAVGWVETLLVHSSANPALLEWCDEQLARLESYSCFDESDLSALEWEEYSETWQTHGANELRRALAREFDLCDAASDAIDSAKVETLREWFEAQIPSGDYHNGDCWPRFDLAAQRASRDDMAGLLRSIRRDAGQRV